MTGREGYIVPADPAAKKTVISRSWILLDCSGEGTILDVDKYAIMHRVQIHARDLRILDPLLSYPSTILGREKAIVLNLEHIKAIITAEEVLLRDPLDDNVIPIVEELRRRLPPGQGDLKEGLNVQNDMDAGEEDESPFEFRALEVALEAICSFLDARTTELETAAYPALDELTSKGGGGDDRVHSRRYPGFFETEDEELEGKIGFECSAEIENDGEVQISSRNLDRVRKLKSAMTRLTARVQKVRDELEQLLDDDDDMADLYLSRKLAGSSSPVSGSGAPNWFPASPTIGSKISRASRASAATIRGDENDVEELEMLLEAYFMQIDGTLNKLTTLREYIDDTEDYINIQLDNHRNQLIQLELFLSSGTVCLSIYSLVAGIFGMNIPYTWNDNHGYMFKWRLGSGADLPQTAFPVTRKVNTFHAVAMDDDLEGGVVGLYQDRPRAFPTMRSKTYVPLIFRILMGINVRVLFVLLLLCFGALFYIGASTSPIIVFVFAVCILSFLLSIYLTKWVLAKDEGPPEMVQISEAIRDGAEGFFRTQYGTISKMALLLALVIFVIYLFRSLTPQQESSGFGRLSSAYITVASFLLGAVCSGVAGYVGMWVSVRANVRVSSAARRSSREALQIAVRAGGFSALVVVGMAVMGVAILYSTFYVLLGVDSSPGSMKVTDLPLLLVGYGFGASFVALFAQLGGGIYTKAADVGADLVGKIEQGIPEDDPRNPAVIADLVGDNVGDCAARGADLFENPSGFILFPLVVHSFDLVISSVGILSIRGTRNPGAKTLIEDPMAILQKGYSITIFLAVLTFGASTRWLLYTEQAPTAWLNFALCGLVGIITAYAFVWITKYYTDYKHEPVRTLALASTTGHGTNIIAGISLGLESTALPVLVISIAIVSAFWLGRTSGLVDETGKPTGGLFGTAVATMGMLSTAAYVLTMDMFGPIADNAGGIVEMSQQPESVREITDVLDAVGNTTKATTKGFAIGSAALASFLLFSAYMDEVASFAQESFEQVDIAIPEVFVGGLLGSMLIFLFSAWACAAVGRTAQEVVNEVRRQFIERPGIMDYKEKPDYGRCVTIVASASLREMIKPGALAIFTPMVVGVLFKILGRFTGHPLLGAKVVASMLMFATVSGILMALFLNTAGGAWDNAKKYIETGALGGKGSDCHKAAITGDTVGDPFKDTAGPSLHVLIKMLATITLVMAPVFL
ncbi:hypothetical protein IFM89_037354 [Coptis chinensis]|uniref:H(+)-exporting diphosphatase n=1 Tax=Coptis chinensis TaxID=261450 RepID=A0A835M5V4_9MAGN|nr:hypothetical protein IFM89_037354 [Coptis chinensis]